MNYDSNKIKSFASTYINPNYIDSVINQSTTLSSNIFVSENNILIVGDNRPYTPQNKLIMIGNISLENNTFDLTYIELQPNYEFNVIFTIVNSNSGNPIGRININIIDVNTNISYPNIFFGSATVTQGPAFKNPVLRLKNNSIYIGYDVSGANITLNMTDLYNGLYDQDYNFINRNNNIITTPSSSTPSSISTSSFFVSGTQLQTNRQKYSNYITDVITKFNKNYISNTITTNTTNTTNTSNHNNWIIIYVSIFICIIVIIIIIVIIVKKNNKKIIKKIK